MSDRLKKLLGASVGALLIAVTAGCGGDDDDAPPPPAVNTAQIRAVHASANTTPVDVYVNGTAIAQNAAFAQQTGFATVASGSTRVQIALTGTPAATAPIDVSVPLSSAVRYTVVAIGDATQPTGGERVQGVVIEDGGAPPASGEAKLRVVHGAPGAGPVDVFVSEATAPLPATATFSNLSFSSVAPASAQPALAISSGDYRIRVRPAGQASIVYDSGPIKIDSGTDLVAVAVRDVGPGPSNSAIQLLVMASTGDGALARDNRVSVRLAHFAPNLPPVDAFLKASGAANDPTNRVASGLSYPSDTGYLSFAAGTYDLSVALVNTLAGTADLNGATLARGTSTSVFALGLLNGAGGQSPQLKAFADDRASIAGQAKVRAIHLAPDAPPVDIVVLVAGVITQRPVTNLAYANATTTPLTLPPGTYTLAVVPTGATSPLLPSAAGVDVTLSAGDVKTIVAIGALAPNATNPASQPFSLRVLDDK